MEDHHRLYTIIGIVVALGVIGVLVYLFFFQAQEVPADEPQPAPIVEPDMTPPPSIIFPLTDEEEENQASQQVRTQPSEEAQQNFVKNLARTFAERFGTYSTQNGNVHIEDALELASPSMADWVAAQEVQQGSVYEGATLTVVEIEVTEFNGSTAEVRMGAQEALNDGSSVTTKYKNGRAELIYLNGTWKVDALYWE